MSRAFKTFAVLLVILSFAAGCQSMTGRSAGQNVDDASVTASVKSVASGCPVNSVKIKPWRGRARVSARGHRRMKLVVRMLPRTPDACQGARFRLRFGGTAVRA